MTSNQGSVRENGADTSEDGDSVASDGGVSLTAGMNLRSDHTPIRRVVVSLSRVSEVRP